MRASKKVVVDLNNQRKNVVHLSQGDNAREVYLVLLKDGVPFNVADDGQEIFPHVKYIKANGVSGDYDMTTTGEDAVELVEDSVHEYIVRIDEHVTDVAGFAEIFVTFSTASDTLHSFPITLDVVRTTTPSTDPSQSYYTNGTFVMGGKQVAKTDSMTNPVGMDAQGRLWTNPSGGVGYVSSVNGVAPDESGDVELEPSDIGAYEKPATGIPWQDLKTDIVQSLGKADSAYQKPQTGIPESDLSEGVQEKLNSGGATWDDIKPEGGVPLIDLAAIVQQNILLGASAYRLPNTGIPESDLSDEVQAKLNSGGGGGVTKYTVTFSGAQAPYTSSMSSSEIYSAVQGGNIVEAVLDGETLTLTKSTTTAALFVGHALTQSEFIGLAIAISGTTALTTTIPIQPKSIADAGGYFTSDTVEGALAEIGAQLDGLEAALTALL